MIPTLEDIEDYIETIEELAWAAAPDLPNVREAVHRLWLDVSRFGPQRLPSFPDVLIFEVPAPPPPPPPPPKSWLGQGAGWAGAHPWATAGFVVGVGLLAGYTLQQRHARCKTARARAAAGSTERRQVVVVLGGDHPLGPPLIHDLEKKGYIVIASVATLHAAEALEGKSSGYVRALILDPTEPGTAPVFLRSLASTLSRRFPINAPGDPHASPAAHPHLHSIISLLSLPPAPAPAPAPMEHLPLDAAYLPYLTATHTTPLRVLQALLPLLRTSPLRFNGAGGERSIVICLPSPATRVGLPFAGAQAMSAAATLRGAEVLRREIELAARADAGGGAGMRGVRVVVADVGAVTFPSPNAERGGDLDVGRAMEAWTPSERAAYGPAFASALTQGGEGRKPAETEVFVDALVRVVSGGSGGGGGGWMCGNWVRKWVRRDRFGVGAGAHTYTLASHLPPALLDALLRIPHVLVSLRDALLPVVPAVIPHPASATPRTHPNLGAASPDAPNSAQAPAPAPKTTLAIEPAPAAETGAHAADDASLSDHASEAGSEADGESWIKA